jgi:hypothetical protein
MLDAEHLAAGATPSRLDLVADEKAAVLPDDADDLFEIFFRRRDKTADALNRLSQEGGDATLRSRRLNRLFDILGAL